MTFQLADVIRFEDIDYQIVMDSNEGLFTPMDFGIYPDNSYLYTGLYKRFLAKYACANDTLYLQELHIIYDTSNEAVPQIGNAQLRKGYSDFMLTSGLIYTNIGLESQYSGGLLVGKFGTANQPLYVNISFYHCIVLWELIFKNGKLQERIDYSDKMASIRERLEVWHNKSGEVSDGFRELMEETRTGYVFDYFPHWSNRSKADDKTNP